MDDLDLLNSRHPVEMVTGRWAWAPAGPRTLERTWRQVGHLIPLDVYEHISLYWSHSPEQAYQDLARAWQAARPDAFPLFEPDTSQT